MDKIIVYVDDAAHAVQQLTPMLATDQQTQWMVVACPPHLTRHASKWISNSARAQWRAQWAEQLCAQIVPLLRQRGDSVTTRVANEPLSATTAQLIGQFGAARVLDARLPKFGQDLAPVTPDQPPSSQSHWALPGSMAALGAVLILASE